MEEIWKIVPGYKGNTQVSDQGRVRGIRYCGRGRIKKINEGSSATYSSVGLTINKKRKTFYVHQLVAMAFLGHVPCGHEIVVDHINGKKKDNRLCNLQLLTQEENIKKIKWNGVAKNKDVLVCFSKTKEKKWNATIYHLGIVENLGDFNTELEAYNISKKVMENMKKNGL